MSEIIKGNQYTNLPAQILDVANSDSWHNLLTGIGTANDKRTHTKMGTPTLFDSGTLTEIYRSDGIGRRGIEIPAKDMVREWFEVGGDPDGKVIKKMESLRTKRNIKEALIWSRLYGGSLVTMLIDDGLDFSQPVNENRINSVEALYVYDRYDIDWTDSDLYNDPKNPNFGRPETYHVSNRSVGIRFPVHESRVLLFDGLLVPEAVKRGQQYWGDSVMTGIYERLRALFSGYSSTETLLEEFILGVMKIKNIQQLLHGPEGRTKIRNRMMALDLSKHIANTLIVDEKEDFQRVAASGTSGMSDSLTKLEVALCSAFGIPYMKLFPEQAKGLGGTAEGNLRFYYDDISMDQTDYLLGPIEKLTRYILLSKELKGKTKTTSEDFSITFNPLWQPTEKEREETRLTTAKRDDIYFKMGMDPELIIKSRYGGDKYSTETVLSGSPITEEDDDEFQEE